MNKVLLVGGGGHCVSCIDLIEQTKDYRIIGILEKIRIILETYLIIQFWVMTSLFLI